MNPLSRSVRIDFVTGYVYPPIIGFDFGDFAILSVYDLLRAGGGFMTFYGSEYQKYHSQLRYELRYHAKFALDFTFNISFKKAEKVYNTFLNIDTTSHKELVNSLESVAPRDILPKFFQ